MREARDRSSSRKAGAQLFGDLLVDGAPLGPAAGGGQQNFHQRPGVLEVDGSQQGMVVGEVLEHRIDDRLRQDLVDVGQGLLGIVGLHGADDGLIVLPLLAGQHPAAPGGEDAVILGGLEGLHIPQDALPDSVRQVAEGLHELLLIVGLHGLGHALEDLRALFLDGVQVLHGEELEADAPEGGFPIVLHVVTPSRPWSGRSKMWTGPFSPPAWEAEEGRGFSAVVSAWNTAARADWLAVSAWGSSRTSVAKPQATASAGVIQVSLSSSAASSPAGEVYPRLVSFH